MIPEGLAEYASAKTRILDLASLSATLAYATAGSKMFPGERVSAMRCFDQNAGALIAGPRN